MAAVDFADVIGELVTAFDTVHGRKRFTPEKGESRNVNAGAAAAGQLREAVVQSATRELETELIDESVGRSVENSIVLVHAGNVAGLLKGGAGAGVLSKILVLGVGLDTG